MALSRTVSLDRKYRTEDGKPVRIYAVDGGGKYPVQGAKNENGEWETAAWTLSGYFYAHRESNLDLVEVVEPAFDVTKEWMRRKDGRRPDKIDLLDDGYVRYWIGNDFFVVDPKGFRAIPAHPSPNDLIPYVAKVREWTRADVPFPRPEFKRRDSEVWYPCGRINEDEIVAINYGPVDWADLARDWLHSTDGGRTWKPCEVSE